MASSDTWVRNLVVGAAAGVAAWLVYKNMQAPRQAAAGAGAAAGKAAAAKRTGRSGQQLLSEIQASVDHNIRLVWDLTPDEIASLVDAYNAMATTVYDRIASGGPTWEETLQILNEDDQLGRLVDSVCTFPQYVSADKAVRDASSEADEKLSKHSVGLNSRFDVYLSIKAYADTKPALEGEMKRYLAKALQGYERKGMHLEKEQRDRILELNERQSKLGIEFSKALGEENTKLYFTAEELDGVPADKVKSLDQEDGKCVVTLKYPDYIPIMKNCKVPATRLQCETAFNSRCIKENAPILEELVELRSELAGILGFATHAAFITDVRMSGSEEKVRSFLSELSDKLTPLMEKDMGVLLELKKAECSKLGLPFDGKINNWDSSYYRNMVEKEHYQVDHEEIKTYFPLERVTTGLLDIYQELLSLVFVPVSTGTWHEEVVCYRVEDKATKATMGHFYLDLHPREGKYGHAACWGLQPGCKISETKRMLPVAACVCNFTKGTKEAPSLMMHSEVETFFHEFGHCMHQLCSEADFSRFAGTAVERDFVEAPSQMLENWCWEKEALIRMSGRVGDNAPLPEELLQSMLKSRNANAGILNKRQVFLATFDQTIHTSKKADTAAEMARLQKAICGIELTPGTNMSASFGHLAGGYDAQYYGYMWSEVFSMDMYESMFKAKGIFNAEVGMAYRKKILAVGGSRDASESLRDFLGRDPTPDAFLRSKGLEVSGGAPRSNASGEWVEVEAK